MHRRRIIGDDDSDHDPGATLCDAAAEPRQLGPCKRRGNGFVWFAGTGRVLAAFRRGTFVVTALDGRPLSWRGSRG
jgi:hypothetical protein